MTENWRFHWFFGAFYQENSKNSPFFQTNLEAKRAEYMRDKVQQIEQDEQKEPDLPKIVYRDRAKERRRQFGIDSTGYAFDVMGGSGSGGARNEDEIRRESEEASKKPLDDSNIGNRLLKSMGWKEGQGVGKHAQGTENGLRCETQTNNFQASLHRFKQNASFKAQVSDRLARKCVTESKRRTRKRHGRHYTPVITITDSSFFLLTFFLFFI